MIAEAVEKDASEDLPGDVQQGDAAVIVADLTVPFSLVEMLDGCVLEILRDFTLTPHLLEERSRVIHQLGTSMLVDLSRDRVRSGCFLAGELLHGSDGFLERWREVEVRVGLHLRQAVDGGGGDGGGAVEDASKMFGPSLENLRRRSRRLASPSTPTYGLAKRLLRRLKFLTAESDTTVSSSSQFLEKLKGLLKFCLRTYFTFDGTVYEQVKGTPMSSPISGFIAEEVLPQLESLAFQHHKPKFWAGYVDDTFVVIDRDQLLTFKERLNAVLPDIQFTMEEEENNELAFLDVLVCRKDCGGLKTKVFRKATNTMQVLNFNSNHPISHKRSCVRTFYRCVETHCSEPEDKIAELQYLRRVFKANGYPRNFVNRCIRKRDERPNRTDTKVWRALPYIKNFSEAVGRLLAPLGVVVAHRPEATIRCQLMKPKDPLPRQETSGVVYRIWCSCGQGNYAGETGRQLQTRMAEHAEAVRRNDASSQVAAHSTGSGHTFKFDEAEILARADNRVSRELLESWFTDPQSINKCNELPIQYSVLSLRLGGVIGHAGSAQVNTSQHPGQRVRWSSNHHTSIQHT
ncbi:hypothetical protein SprV_0301360200 [Sparganum proliferum]